MSTPHPELPTIAAQQSTVKDDDDHDDDHDDDNDDKDHDEEEEHGATSRELKSCGHFCYPSALIKCCSCEDLRPASGCYERYVDGVGRVTTAARDDGYCPVCNTKNYDRWMERAREGHVDRKRREDGEREERERAQALAAEIDRAKHANQGSGRIEYASGNVYVGDLCHGEPHGAGRMDYADNDNNILSYEGEWSHGKHHGQGKKLWMDNVYYEGRWVDGMMHGTGYFRMNDVEALDGEFENDEFCG